MVVDWIYRDNLRPFLTALGWVVGYNFDEVDWEAICHGLRETNAEADRWFEYELSGNYRAAFSLALDDGSVVMARIGVPSELESQIRLLREFCATFLWNS